jgi:HK97 family phage prohead protease
MGKRQGLERKVCALKLDAPPDDEGRFTGYAAVFGNVDKGNDVIEAGAFTKTLQENPTVPILWAHDPDEPIGISTFMAEDGKGLKVEGQLAMEVQRACEVHALMKLDAVKGLSIGYNTVKRHFKGPVRYLQELELGEFSPVVFAMNPLAEVGSVKSNKWLGQYGATESVDCLLSMIGQAADYLADEVEKADTEDAARIQSVLSVLTDCLASELADVGTGEDDNGDEADFVVWVEQMRAPVDHAIKKLEALLTHEPAAATRTKAAAPPDDAEPAAATLRALMADIKST